MENTKTLKCTDYGFTVIDCNGNIIDNITDYNDLVSMVIVRDIRKMREIPLEYIQGDGITTPNLFNCIINNFDPNKHRWLDWHCRVYIAVADLETCSPYFIDITNQVKTLQRRVIYFDKKEE